MKKLSQQHKLSFTRPATAACSMLVVLACVRAGLAQQVGKTPPASTQSAPTAVEPVRSLAAAPALVAAHPASVGEAQEAHETATPKKHGGEGIKVHGHWEITVKNADGSVAERRDFENSLTTTSTVAGGVGSQVLAALLSGNGEPGLPGLALIQTVPTDPTRACFGTTVNCTILVMPNTLIQTTGGYSSFTFITQPGLTATATFTPSASLALAGAFQQSAAGPTTYTAVQAIFPMCYSFNTPNISGTAFGGGDLGPNQCNPGGVSASSGLTHPNENVELVPLTFTLITQGGTAAPLTLQPSQTISISFTLTFS
jgi:hypothetical protein